MKTLAHVALLAILFLAIVFVARDYSHRTQVTWGAPIVYQPEATAAQDIVPPAGPVVRQGLGFAPTPRAPGPSETMAHILAPLLPGPVALCPPLPKPRPHSAPKPKQPPKPKLLIKAVPAA